MRKSFPAAAALIVSAAALFIPYLQRWGGSPFSRPDADIVFAYQALLLGDGGVQGDTAHHGYIYFLFLSWWYRLAHAVGALAVFRLSDLNAVPDVISTFADLVIVGRIFSLVVGIAFAAVFALALWRITRDRLVTLVVGLLFALGEGLAFQTILLRTELLAVFLLVMAFAALLLAVEADAQMAALWLLLAGFSASLSYNTKVQIFFSLVAMPVLAIAFGRTRISLRAQESAQRRATRVAWTILWILATPAWLAVLRKVGSMGPLSLFYVPAIAAYCLACIAIYGRRFGYSTSDQCAAALWMYCGFGIGFSLLFLHRHPAIFAIDANPLEHMSSFMLQADIKTFEPERLGSAAPAILVAVLRRVLDDWFGGNPLGSAYRLSFWVSAVFTAALCVLRQWRPALQAALLIALASLLNGINGVRYGAVTPVYSIFVDPWIFLAMAIAAAAVRRGLARSDVRTATTAALLITGFLIAQRNIDSGSRNWAQPAANICVQANGYLAQDIAKVFRPLCQ